MKVYIVIKDSDRPNPYDCPNDIYYDIDCVKATRDGAIERLKELALKGYRKADIIEKEMI